MADTIENLITDLWVERLARTYERTLAPWRTGVENTAPSPSRAVGTRGASGGWQATPLVAGSAPGILITPARWPQRSFRRLLPWPDVRGPR